MNILFNKTVSTNASTSLRVDEVKTIEVGFVKLYNGNTVYTYVKVNDSLVAWELVEAYGKTAGNVAIVAAGSSDSFTIA